MDFLNGDPKILTLLTFKMSPRGFQGGRNESLKLCSHVSCDWKEDTKPVNKIRALVLKAPLPLADHYSNWAKWAPLYLLLQDKSIGILAKERDINPGAFEVVSGLMFKTLLPRGEGSDTT